MPTFVVGDVHGHVEALATLLREAGLVDDRLDWSGGDARLWLMGDLVDRGPDGIGAVELVMKLERQGDVRCLLGNHEAALVAAGRYPDAEAGVPGLTFRALWEVNGGIARDLERLRPEHVAWIEARPAVALEGDHLLVHSDTDLYLRYGVSVDAVRRKVSAVVAGGTAGELAFLLETLADRGAFWDDVRRERLLGALGGERVVHGHTPVWYATGADPAAVSAPYAYAEGRALNVDHGLYSGGPGFVAELSARAPRA